MILGEKYDTLHVQDMETNPSDNQIEIPSKGIVKTLYGKVKQFVLNFLNGQLGGHWCMFWAFLLLMLYPVLSDMTAWRAVSRLALCYAAYFLAYACTYIGSLVKPKVLRRIYFTIVFAIIFVYSIMDTACSHVLYTGLNRDKVYAILATNANEASEFFNAYFTPQVIGAVSILIVLIVGLFVLFKRVKFKTSVIACRIGVLLFLACAKITIGSFWICEDNVIGFVRNVFDFITMSKVEVCQDTPKLTVNSNNQTPLIIFVIGESLTNHHCSLYGYDKPTNPFTKPRVDKGEVLLFKNVKSAGLYTLASFQKMMSTYEKSMGDKVKWNECPTLPNIAKVANYHTHWISNQSKKGLHDNIVGQYSDFCDTCVFIGNKFAGMARTSYDGELLPVFKSMLQRDKTAHNFYILHQMGCHVHFAARYPSSFNFFKENDYKNYPENQRILRAAYDNAVRYNDYVVNSVFDMVSQRDAIVIFAPDHGLDIYESNPNAAGHCNVSNPISVKAAHDIPFLIYMTPLFRERHGDFAQRAQQSVDREFDMEDIIYLIMDLMQCDFEKPMVAQKSLIRK